MSNPFLSEIRIMAFGTIPKGWAQCNGQLIGIQQNQALFALLGTTYGGNGTTNFALPNLQGKVPLHIGTGFIQGQTSGEYNHTLLTLEMPVHNHGMMAAKVVADLNGGDVPGPTKALAEGITPKQGGGSNPVNIYGTGSLGLAFNAAAISKTGSSQAHPNIQPYLALNFCIAIVGVFPSRN